MTETLSLELPAQLRERIDQLAKAGGRSREEIILLALEGACTPSGHKLQQVYDLCRRADAGGPEQT